MNTKDSNLLEPKMTIASAAEFLNITPQAVHKQIKSKSLRCPKIGNKYYLNHSIAKELFNLKFTPQVIVGQIVKGGTGKTTTIDNLACCVNSYGARVLKIDTELIANMFLNLQIRGSGGTDRLRNIFNDKIRRKFEAIDGIANVELFGGSEKSVEIILNKEASEAYNITPNKIRSLIAGNNMDKRYIGKISSEQKKHFVNLKIKLLINREVSCTLLEP